MSVRVRVRSAAFILWAALVCATALPRAAAAQPLGNFAWQLQPFCNKVTVNVTQSGAIYTLDGYDDQCGGAATKAPLVGVATPNPDGSISFGLHVVVPGGIQVGIDARISLATLGGTWTDSARNAGTFAFGANVAGSPRPIPVPGSVPPGVVNSASIADGTVGAVDVNTAEIQRRISATCPAGTFMGGADASGGPLCGAPLPPDWGTVIEAPATGAATGLKLRRDSAVTSFSPAALLVEYGVPAPGGFPPASGVGVFSTSRDRGGVTGVSQNSFGVAGVSTLGIGVIGATLGPGVGVSASANGLGGVALEISGGAIKVSGEPDVRPVFQHTSAAGNVFGARTRISHLLLNGDPNAIVVANHVFVAGGAFLSSVAVFYDTAAGGWSILREDGLVMPAGEKFNVFVIKQ